MDSVVDVHFREEVLQLKLERKGFKDKEKTKPRWALVLVQKKEKVVRKELCTSQERGVLQEVMAAAARLPLLKGADLDPFSKTSALQVGLAAIWAKELKKLEATRKEEHVAARARKAAKTQV